MKRWFFLLGIALLIATAMPSVVFATTRINICFPTSGTSGTLYPLGLGIANLWNIQLDDINVRVQISNGGIQNLNLLKAKDAQVSFAVASSAYEAMHGMRAFKNRPYKDVRVMAGLYLNPNQVVARAGTGATQLRDFKEKRFALGAAGSSTAVETRLHLTAAGLRYPEDIKPQGASTTEVIALLRDKQIDGAWIMAGIPTAAVAELCATADGNLVPISDEVIASLQAEYPWYVKFTIPAGTYANQREDVQTTAVKMLLLTDASMPEEIIYALTKCFWENLPTLTKAHAVMETVTPDMGVKDLASIPLHPGAEKYYREIGLNP